MLGFSELKCSNCEFFFKGSWQYVSSYESSMVLFSTFVVLVLTVTTLATSKDAKRAGEVHRKHGMMTYKS